MIVQDEVSMNNNTKYRSFTGYHIIAAPVMTAPVMTAPVMNDRPRHDLGLWLG
jgi:hypothetical protein